VFKKNRPVAEALLRKTIDLEKTNTPKGAYIHWLAVIKLNR